MMSFGLDLAKSPAQALGEGFGTGLVYALLVVVLGRPLLRAAADGRRPCRGQPDDVAGAAEADAVPAGRLRRLPGLLPRRPGHLLHGPGGPADRPAGLHHAAFYGHDEALGRQAQRASEQARELAKQDSDAGGGGGGGLFGQARRDLSAPKADKAAKTAAVAATATAAATATVGPARPTKRTTAPKNRPTPSGKHAVGSAASVARSRPGRSAAEERLASAGAEEELSWSGSRRPPSRSRRRRSWPSTSSGSALDDAEFEVLEEPRPGLFGRVRGEARVRARVQPTPVRPKQDRREPARTTRRATERRERRRGHRRTRRRRARPPTAAGDAADGDGADTPPATHRRRRTEPAATTDDAVQRR